MGHGHCAEHAKTHRGVLHGVLGVHHRVLGVLHRVLGVLHKVPGVLHSVLGVRHRVLGVLHSVLGVLRRVLGVPHRVLGNCLCNANTDTHTNRTLDSLNNVERPQVPTPTVSQLGA